MEIVDVVWKYVMFCFWNREFQFQFKVHLCLTHSGPVMPYGNIDQGQN